MSTFAGLCPHCGGAGMRAAFAAYDCHGGPGTTRDACGACVTCLLREIEKKDARIKVLESELDLANARMEFLAKCAYRTPASWGYTPASWGVSLTLPGDDSAKDLMPHNFLSAVDAIRGTKKP